MPLSFSILTRSPSHRARLGRVSTPHGSFDTPAFMPVGTRGTVKGILPALVAQTGAQIVLANTYHLMLRPGSQLIQRMGGVQRFTGWHGPMLTDSGGYQAYSMAGINSVSDDAVRFKSIIDGAIVELSPESAMRIQNELGADIIMAFDDCPPSVDPDSGPINQTRLRIAAMRDARDTGGPALRAGQIPSDQLSPSSDPARPNYKKKSTAYDHAARLKLANQRTIRWLERCKAEHHRLGGHDLRALFGIIQGGTDLDQRKWSLDHVCSIELPGYAIGGVAVGEQFDDIRRVVNFTAPLMPDAKPRYLMGVGYERDLLAAVLAGVDMFDCVLPTRNGRNANAFTSTGQIRLRNAQFAEDPRPIEPGCDCAACSPSSHLLAPPWGPSATSPSHPNTTLSISAPKDSHFSRAYIRHLFLSKEMLGPILVSLHNLRHFQRFMDDLRRTIPSGAFEGFVNRWPVAADGLSPAPVP